MEKVLKNFIIYSVIFLIITFIYDMFEYEDNTDPVDGHSGFILMTDNLTGCQYLQAGYFGGIYPRLDRNGNHICN